MRAVFKATTIVLGVLGALYAPLAQAAHLSFDRVTAPAAPTDTRLSADLNGDGLKDEVWFSHNGQDRLHLHVRFAGADFGEDQIVTGLDAAQAHQLQSAPAGAYRLDCGDFASACDQEIVRTDHDGLILSLDEGLTILIHWNGEAFEQDFVASNEVRLRRAMAVRFALNL